MGGLMSEQSFEHKFKISATNASTYLRCKKKFYINYYDKKVVKLSNDSFKLGRAVHEALEFAGYIYRDNGSIEKKDHQSILDKYFEVAVREGLSDMDMLEDGKAMVKTRMQNFCDPGSKIIGMEVDFGFRDGPDITTSLGTPIMGSMDRIEEVDPDTLMIWDYKTSASAPTTAQIRTDFQLSLYDLAASILWPQYKKRILALDYLKHDVLYTYRTDEEREEFTRYIYYVYQGTNTLTKEKATADLNFFCPWCDFKDYCDEYLAACAKTEYEFKPITLMQPQEIVTEWRQVKDTINLLDRRKTTLDEILSSHIAIHDKNIDLNDEKQIGLRQSRRTSYDMADVLNHVPLEDLPQVCKIDNKQLLNYANNRQYLKQTIKSLARISYTKPFLVEKDIKK